MPSRITEKCSLTPIEREQNIDLSGIHTNRAYQDDANRTIITYVSVSALLVSYQVTNLLMNYGLACQWSARIECARTEFWRLEIIFRTSTSRVCTYLVLLWRVLLPPITGPPGFVRTDKLKQAFLQNMVSFHSSK